MAKVENVDLFKYVVSIKGRKNLVFFFQLKRTLFFFYDIRYYRFLIKISNVAKILEKVKKSEKI